MPTLIALMALGTVALLVWVGSHRRRWAQQKIERQVKALCAAAADDEELRRELGRGTPIDVQDAEGNSALHLAYYQSKEDAIARMVAFDADENLRNREGLKPDEMAAVASTEALLTRAAYYLNAGGSWSNPTQARVLYDQLRTCSPRIYNPAIVRVVLKIKDRRRLLVLALKVGVSGSEQRLAQVLDGYGTKAMAEDYLNAGSVTLRAAAERWAGRHNYHIASRTYGSAAIWGTF